MKNNELYQLAIESREKSYSPYSELKVGSSIKFRNNSQLFGGCNIENASFGGTICAERCAILKGLSELGAKNILEEVWVVIDMEKEFFPCGICLQTISEFADKETTIHLATPEKLIKSYKFNELLPKVFKM